MPLMRKVLLSASRSRWLSERAMRSRVVRRATRRFMPGERLDDALTATRELERAGMPTILTRLGENLESEADARAVGDHYVEAHERVRAAGVNAEMSVKLTQLGLDLSPATARANLVRIAAAAAAQGRTVWVDMEGSAYTQATLDLYRSARAERANLGIAVQAYLRRTADDLEALIAAGAAIRLVKGAYDEPERIAFRTRSEVDANYVRLAGRLLAGEALAAGVFPAFGTHDERIIEHLRAHAAEAGVAKERYEFEMLYGIRRELQARLAGSGHRVRVLISYGEAWFPWYMRRLAERPANVWFVARSVFAR
ncbi:MAG: proline dehydrogenase family protein [Candidatus Eisenbacteria bacterium]|nr:proline dehydrogenase family protein [Candidatus Eisenbacteria bacterium]